jgi:hypothetical protein
MCLIDGQNSEERSSTELLKKDAAPKASRVRTRKVPVPGQTGNLLWEKSQSGSWFRSKKNKPKAHKCDTK